LIADAQALSFAIHRFLAVRDVVRHPLRAGVPEALPEPLREPLRDALPEPLRDTVRDTF
jgi:hypothetical protein